MASLSPGTTRHILMFYMFAVIFTGGKQYLVEEGQTIKIEKLDAEAGSDVTFDQVLMTAKADGQDVVLGTPFLDGVTVTGVVEDHGRGDKIRVVKYKPKVRYKRTIGHKQHFTEVTIKKIA